MVGDVRHVTSKARVAGLQPFPIEPFTLFDGILYLLEVAKSLGTATAPGELLRRFRTAIGRPDHTASLLLVGALQRGRRQKPGGGT